MRGYLTIVPVAARGSTGLYVRRESDDRGGSPLRGPGVQETGCGTEVKTHTLEREEALRSKTPARIRQELWGLAIGYNLVRLAMARVAERAGVAPTRISFRHALQFRVFSKACGSFSDLWAHGGEDIEAKVLLVSKAVRDVGARGPCC